MKHAANEYHWRSPWGTIQLCATNEGVSRIVLPRGETEAASLLVSRDAQRSASVQSGDAYRDSLDEERAPLRVVANQEWESVADVLEAAVAWLTLWLEGHEPSHESFPASAAATATDFSTAVWQAIREIPRGETRTYGELAAQLGKPRAARALGRACGQNPLPLWTPCHRVVGADGRLTGFSGGAGIATKRRLLTWERNAIATAAPIETFAQPSAPAPSH